VRIEHVHRIGRAARFHRTTAHAEAAEEFERTTH
jgi:hypothetical protein